MSGTDHRTFARAARLAYQEQETREVMGGLAFVNGAIHAPDLVQG
jgi:hypothetical protein